MRSRVSATAWHFSSDGSRLRTDVCVPVKKVPPCAIRSAHYYGATNRMFVKNRGSGMSKPLIDIVIPPPRTGRCADKPVEWLWNLVSRRSDMEFEIVDLRRYPLPFFDESMSPAWGAPKNEVA